MPEDAPERPVDSAVEKLFYRTERVRFIYWRQFSGAKPTVVLMAVLTVLSFISGLSNLSNPDFQAQGPLVGVFPGGELYGQFGGVIFAFVLGILTLGLQRRKNLALDVSLVVLALLGMLPLITLQATDFPLLLLVIVTIPLLVWNREDFDQSIDLSPLQIASLSSVLGVIAYGTFGTYGLRDSFVGGQEMTWGDAFYFVIVTIATVGYGDITPTGPVSRWFSLSIIVFGTGAFTLAVSSLLVPAIESRMAAAFGNMTASELTLLEDHVLVLGYGDITEALIEELHDEVEVAVITSDPDVASDLKNEDINVLTDDPTDEQVLMDARIESASGVVVATRDDADDVLAVLAARNTNPDIWIAAAANHRKNIEKLEQVGADEVISPMTIGGRVLGRSVIEKTHTDSLFETATPEDKESGANDSEETV